MILRKALLFGNLDSAGGIDINHEFKTNYRVDFKKVRPKCLDQLQHILEGLFGHFVAQCRFILRRRLFYGNLIYSPGFNNIEIDITVD